jgi:hypothetical protein
MGKKNPKSLVLAQPVERSQANLIHVVKHGEEKKTELALSPRPKPKEKTCEIQFSNSQTKISLLLIHA